MLPSSLSINRFGIKRFNTSASFFHGKKETTCADLKWHQILYTSLRMHTFTIIRLYICTHRDVHAYGRVQVDTRRHNYESDRWLFRPNQLSPGISSRSQQKIWLENNDSIVKNCVFQSLQSFLFYNCMHVASFLKFNTLIHDYENIFSRIFHSNKRDVLQETKQY